MTTHRGFHPGRRLVHRLGRISPHHQIQLLGVISLVLMAVIVGSVVGALAPTHRSLENSTERLVPATRKLDLARASYNATAAVLQQIVDPGPEVRATSIALVVMLVAFGVVARSARARDERLEHLDRDLHREYERNELDACLQRSLEMARTEPAAYQLIGRALQETAVGLASELLIADSSRAHFRQAVSTRPGEEGCPVTAPRPRPTPIR